jgi:hypothetical protein
MVLRHRTVRAAAGALVRRIAGPLHQLIGRIVVPIPPTCRVYVDAISFNHDPSTFTSDAINIRHDRSQPVQVPEWTRGQPAGTVSPAAYCIEETAGNDVFIRVRFTTGPGTSVAWVSASGGGVLGGIDPIRVNFANGVSVPEFVQIPLGNHTLAASPGIHDIEWQWQFRCLVGNTYWDMNRSAHRIYVLRRAPREPWNQIPGSDHNPWTTALDYACAVPPVTWVQDPFDAVADALAEALNWGGVNANAADVVYDVAATMPHYAIGSTFELTKFLERLRGGLGNGDKVNCSDCACAITTLANLLGCDLWEGEILTGAVNPLVPIGFGQWWDPGIGFLPSPTAPAPGSTLLYHEVAWKTDAVADSLIWDLCYVVNGFEDPGNPQTPHPTMRVVQLPYGVQFADPAAFDYREQLAQPASVGNTVPAAKMRRKVT